MSPVAKYPQDNSGRPAFLQGIYLDLCSAIDNFNYDEFFDIYKNEKTEELVYDKIYAIYIRNNIK